MGKKSTLPPEKRTELVLPLLSKEEPAVQIARRVLWRHLRARRLMGYRFRRQLVIEPCIVDFACLEAGSIIEADGGQHSDQVAYDARRTLRLEGMGYRFMPPHPVPLPGERE
jgi:hypothetical protein